MKDKRLQKYIERKFYNQIFYKIKDYIDENKNNVSDICTFHDYSVVDMWLGDDDDYKFYGFIKVDAIIKNFQDDYEDGHREVLYVKFHADLKDFDKTFNILYVSDQYEKLNRPLKDNFLPFYNDKDYESVADGFLNKYYPEYFSAEEFDVGTLLSNMGLKLQTERLTKDKCIFGMIAYEDVSIEVFDILGNPSEKAIKANTIIIDGNCIVPLSKQDKNLFTIVHECVHYYVHRKYYYYQKMFNSVPLVSRCHIVDEYSNHDEDKKWMEIHANKIASRILMPLNKIRKSIDYFLKSHELNNRTEYEKMLDYLKSVYKVSYEALKLRLRDLQYNKLKGIREYVDGEYLRSYIFDNEIESNESYSIETIQLARVIFLNHNLKMLLECQKYVYVEGHVCLNVPKYVDTNGDIYILTDYALNHIDECCLKFTYQIIGVDYKNPDILIHCRVPSYIKVSVSCNDYKVNEDSEECAVDYNTYLSRLAAYKDSLPESFTETLRTLIKDYAKTSQRKGTQLLAAEFAGVDPSTIQRWLSGQCKPTKEALLRFCIGLKIPKEIGISLFKKAGFELMNNNIKDFFIMDALIYTHGNNVEKVMEIYESLENE